MLNDQDFHFLDLVEILDDPRIETEQADGIHLELNIMLTELQSLPAIVATDYMVAVIRAAEIDLDGVRTGINKKLRAIDIVLGGATGEMDGHGDLLRRILDQTERIERELSRDINGGIHASVTAIDPSAYYDYGQVAKMLGVSASTIYRIKADGRLQAIEIGRRVRFLGEHILALKEVHRANVQVLDVRYP